MKIVGYIRVSTDKQNLDKQRRLLLEYAQQEQWTIQEFVDSEVSSNRKTKKRRIGEIRSKLQKGDILLVAELSQLGRNMLETLDILNGLSKDGISITFVRQPELSTTGPNKKLLLHIYSYFAEAEREYISTRTKKGLAAAKAKGKVLGRPRGSRNRNRVLDPYKEQIKSYLQLGINLASIMKIINNQLDSKISYNSFKYFVQHERDLLKLWKTQRRKKTTDV